MRGVSFVFPDTPSEPLFVVNLVNAEGDSHWLVAQVVHCEQGCWEGKRQWLIECQFIRRLSGEADYFACSALVRLP